MKKNMHARIAVVRIVDVRICGYVDFACVGGWDIYETDGRGKFSRREITNET